MFSEELMRLWGFHPLAQAYYASALEQNANLLPARVISTSQDHAQVRILGQQTILLARARGSLLRSGERALAGDWVLLLADGQDHQFVPMEGILPRKTELKRSSGEGVESLVANADAVALVTSCNRDLNVRRLERGLVMIQESGARPMVLLNKSDLMEAAEVEALALGLRERLIDVPVISCSAQELEGIEAILTHVQKGEVLALLGMSGVGKSSLTNALLKGQVMAVQGIREDDARGRHTTTSRELFLTEHGFWLVDTPGIREFGQAGEEEALDSAFADIQELAAGCRFGDCHHESEPGCGIREALQNGELEEDRWQNYLKLQRELEFQKRKGSKALQSEQKKLWAKRNQDLRARLKQKGRK